MGWREVGRLGFEPRTLGIKVTVKVSCSVNLGIESEQSVYVCFLLNGTVPILVCGHFCGRLGSEQGNVDFQLLTTN